MRCTCLFVAVLSVVIATSASAGHVSFTEQSIFSSTDIAGGPARFVAAENYVGCCSGVSAGDLPLDIDIADGTVAFANVNPGAGNGGFPEPTLGGDPDVNTMLAGSHFSNNFGSTFSGLTPGTIYRLQVFGYATNGANVNDVEVDGETYQDWNTDTGHPFAFTNQARVLTATWTQQAGQTDVTMNITDGGGVGGVLLHEVPEPSAAALAGLCVCLFGLVRKRSTGRRRG